MPRPDDQETIRSAFEQWERETPPTPEGADPSGGRFLTDSGIPIRPLYTPQVLEEIGFDYLNDSGFPGSFPCTRGIEPGMYRTHPLRTKQYVGFGSVEETNELYRNLIQAGQNVISMAYDLPTQQGYDSDDPRVEGEVGKIGVPVCSLRDWEMIFDGIDLGQVMVGSVANAQASVAMAWHLATGEAQGVDPRDLRGLTQNDILKEFLARGNYIFPPEHSMRLVTDMMVFAWEHLPNYIPLYICPYHIREAGANAYEEIAFGLCNGIAYIDRALERGMDIDDIAPRITCLITGYHRDFMEEVAKFRAIRRLWARIMKERYGAKDPRSFRLSMWHYEGGIHFTVEQPEINIARAAIAALAGALGGVQDVGLCTHDEALGTPSQKALTIALRTSQIVAQETGVTLTADPLAGSYYLEYLTHELESRAKRIIDKVDELGGMAKAIEKGYPQVEILRSAHEHQQKVERGDRVVVGHNRFVSEEQEKLRTFYRPKPEMVDDHIERLRKLRRERDKGRVSRALDDLKRVAEKPEGNENNMMLPIVGAVKSYATVGEICAVMRDVFGQYQEITGF